MTFKDQNPYCAPKGDESEAKPKSTASFWGFVAVFLGIVGAVIATLMLGANTNSIMPVQPDDTPDEPVEFFVEGKQIGNSKHAL